MMGRENGYSFKGWDTGSTEGIRVIRPTQPRVRVSHPNHIMNLMSGAHSSPVTQSEKQAMLLSEGPVLIGLKKDSINVLESFCPLPTSLSKRQSEARRVLGENIRAEEEPWISSSNALLSSLCVRVHIAAGNRGSEGAPLER